MYTRSATPVSWQGVAPSQSTLAYEDFRVVCRSNKLFRSTFGPDCDSWPIIRREWRIADIEGELLDVAIAAWTLCGEVVSAILSTLGAEPLEPTLFCHSDSERVRTMAFSRDEFFLAVDGDGAKH